MKDKINKADKKSSVSDEELVKVIRDFLDMGHVENIVAMFRQDSQYYLWSGKIMDDERFNVRLGMSVLFEELQLLQPDKTPLAIPSLVDLLNSPLPVIRGDVLSVLDIIGTDEAKGYIRQSLQDENKQVVELAEVLLDE